MMSYYSEEREKENLINEKACSECEWSDERHICKKFAVCLVERKKGLNKICRGGSICRPLD